MIDTGVDDGGCEAPEWEVSEMASVIYFELRRLIEKYAGRNSGGSTRSVEGSISPITATARASSDRSIRINESSRGVVRGERMGSDRRDRRPRGVQDPQLRQL
jgi:hypothetical protein